MYKYPNFWPYLNLSSFLKKNKQKNEPFLRFTFKSFVIFTTYFYFCSCFWLRRGTCPLSHEWIYARYHNPPEIPFLVDIPVVRSGFDCVEPKKIRRSNSQHFDHSCYDGDGDYKTGFAKHSFSAAYLELARSLYFIDQPCDMLFDFRSLGVCQ